MKCAQDAYSESTGSLVQLLTSYYIDDLIDGADLIGISLTGINQIIPSFVLAGMIKKKNPAIKIVLGGSVPTRWFADRNNLPNIFEFVDYVIVNEGEVPIVALVDYLEGRSSIQDVPQLFYLNDNKEITYNNLPISNPEICALPTPVFNKADIGRYLSPVPSLPLLGCRGCYWCKCTFCDHSFVYNNDYRPANVDKVLFDINNYIDEYNVRYINFHDEAMTPSGLLGLSNRLIEDGADIKWSTDARLDRGLTYDILKTAHKAGLSILFFGLESINNRVIKLMNKGTHVDVSSFSLERQAEELRRYAKQAGYTIVGAAAEHGSGMTLDRPALQEVMEAVLAGKVDVVLISSLDRIGRDWGMTKQYIALLTEHKVKLLCLRERVSSDSSGFSPFST